MPTFSVVIPLYNRPQEIDELLESLCLSSNKDFEIIIVEDGSQIDSKDICNNYVDKLEITYVSQENTGPGLARNKGASFAKGTYIIFFDSDCIIPPNYFENVINKLDSIDCYGGADMAHESFTTTQKAINYAMTSTLTTGGIRGGKKRQDKFYPRSFNLGIKREVFEELKGFKNIRFGEDLDFSMRVLESGYNTALIEGAEVYHKRRNDMKSFFKQIFNSGIARINLSLWHKGSFKIMHSFPAAFVLGYLFGGVAFAFFPPLYLLLLIPAFAFFIDSLLQNKNLSVAMKSIVASFTQLFAYGLGFIYGVIKILILKKEEKGTFTETFYK